MTKLIFSFAFCIALVVNVATAQTLGTTKDTAASMESTGVITDYTPDSALVLDTGSGEPVHFKFAREVQYVDADGKVIQAAGLRKNLRVKVHYLKQGGDMVVDKVTLAQ